MDYQLGQGINGLELYQQLQQYWGKVPGILVSAAPEPDLAQRSKAEGLLFLAKPIKPAALRAGINHLKTSDRKTGSGCFQRAVFKCLKDKTVARRESCWPSWKSVFFLIMLVVVSLAFGLVLEPFWGCIFGLAPSLLFFYPVQQKVLRLIGDKPNRAALITLLLCVLIVILPVLAIGAAFIQEGIAFYDKIEKGEINPDGFIESIRQAFPVVTEVFSSFWYPNGWSARKSPWERQKPAVCWQRGVVV